MPKNICPALNNESESDDDDVDLFVSPRHFVGRTPGPKATKQKIFEEKSSSTTHETTPQPRTLQSNLAFGIENVKYMINTDDSGKFPYYIIFSCSVMFNNCPKNMTTYMYKQLTNTCSFLGMFL